MQLIVVGFHRSGTSLLTQLLHAGGLFVGEKLLGALPSNPYGHFEDREVLELHRQVMDDHGVSWQVDGPQLFRINRVQWKRMEQFAQRRDAQHSDWGFKDPRVCFFLGAWKYLLPEAKFVVIYRDPADSVKSLETRQAAEYFQAAGPSESHLRFFTEPDHGLNLWTAHYQAVIAFARQHQDDCLVLPLTDLYEGYPVVRQINERFGSQLDELPTEAVFDAQATGSRDYSQWFHTPGLDRVTQRVWNELVELTNLTEAPA